MFLDVPVCLTSLTKAILKMVKLNNQVRKPYQQIRWLSGHFTDDVTFRIFITFELSGSQTEPKHNSFISKLLLNIYTIWIAAYFKCLIIFEWLLALVDSSRLKKNQIF